MNRLRNRLILIFLAATLVPLGVTLWITTSLLERSLTYTSTRELDELSKSLEKTGREYYQQARENLRVAAVSGHIAPAKFALADRASWPETVAGFWDSGEPERFALSGDAGDRLDYLVRGPQEIRVYTMALATGMNQLTTEYRHAREQVAASRSRDLRRGFTYTYVLLASLVWLSALAILVYLAHRLSRPIQQLTQGLAELAGGNFKARIESDRDDEIGRAIAAFNRSAGDLERSRDRLIYLTQLASWQTLARKMAHEVKNSLTPIRLTVEEMLARDGGNDRKFLEQAAQIVVDEIETLERRIRAFSEFAAEPPLDPHVLDVNALVEDRIAFLKAGHPEVSYQSRLAADAPSVVADEDLVKGILVNLVENAAEAAGSGGRILAVTHAVNGHVEIEIHDSGPGLSEQARRTLFQPTISFKKGGTGLGLSIARKSALVSGGDLLPVPGELGGAGFRLILPAGTNGQ